MTTTRRDVLSAGLVAAGAAASPSLAGAQEPDHDHDHDHQDVPSDPALRAKALESLMVAKGLVDRAALDALIDTYEHKVGPRNGARVVARAWVDGEYKKRLLSDANAAVTELGYRATTLTVVENTAKIHNLVVCTLCSCYPHDLLGDPPWWYRDDSYKERIVRDARGMLAERFNLRLPDHVEVRVHDSTSDVRWMVLPCRPADTDGWSEEQLARLVTIESLVGTAPAVEPAQGGR